MGGGSWLANNGSRVVGDKNLRYRMWIFDQAHVTFMILRLRSFNSKRNVIIIFFLSVELLKKISSNDVNINNPALRVPPGGNQVDGLPPAAVSQQQYANFHHKAVRLLQVLV